MSEPLRWLRAPAAPLGRCLFLDRDGVINERIIGGYVTRLEEFVWRPDAFGALRAAVRAGLPLVVVTNQSCIGRGIVPQRDAVRILERMVDELEAAGVPVAAWYCCPHAPAEGCACRKPGPGMLESAGADLALDLRACYLVGDSESDLGAARAVGCPAWLVDDAGSSLAHAVAQIVAACRLEGSQCSAC